VSFDPPTLPPTQPEWGQFQIWWQSVIESISGEFGALQAAIDAQASADAAQASADETQLVSAIATSWTVPAELMTATDTGSDVTIAIAAHTRIYEDGVTVSVAGHTFTGQAYGTDLGIYYDDVTRADTSPTYHITTNQTRAQNNYVAGRHRVAVLTTPGAGDPPVSGGSTPPGGGHDPIDKYSTL
jgi:hypothetical protein